MPKIVAKHNGHLNEDDSKSINEGLIILLIQYLFPYPLFINSIIIIIIMSLENTSMIPTPARVLGERIQPLDELANIALSSSSSSSSSLTPQKRKLLNATLDNYRKVKLHSIAFPSLFAFDLLMFPISDYLFLFTISLHKEKMHRLSSLLSE